MTCHKRLQCPSGPLCGHRAIVDAYRAERQRCEDLAEAQGCGYSAETSEWVQEHPLPTFHNWLIQGKRPS